MNNMHEAPLLHLLERRFQAGFIYTFTGDILISVNPYQLMPNLYSLAAPKAAPGVSTALDPGAPRGDPHVFTVAERAHRALLESVHSSQTGFTRNQALIVSGESGAGKTEACKYIMQYLAHLSHRRTGGKDSGGGSTSARDLLTSPRDELSIERRVLNCNPFLEAFGNAKTLRNDNSSRFGKFLRIEYDEEGRISGARLTHYLLEKARVVHPNPGERNYHIFYQLLRGATQEECSELLLGEVGDFAYLSTGDGGSSIIEGLNDAEEFSSTKSALATVGITPETQKDLWRALAALLHLGNITFSPTAEEPNEARITSEFSAQTAGKLMGCGGRLAGKLIRRLMRVKGRSSVYEVALNERQAAVARDSLAKSLYEHIFQWLIRKCNRKLSSFSPSSSFIGILDIFGFEIFENNSFEQLCINYANEKLQSLFNHHIFVAEQEAYRNEGIDTTNIVFTSNTTCVELLEARGYGLLPALDEVAFLNREESTDGSYLDKIDKLHRGRHPHYENSRRPTPGFFSVQHFAGRVRYNVEGFLEKNNDTLSTDLEDLLRASDDPFMRELYSPPGAGEMELGVGGGGHHHHLPGTTLVLQWEEVEEEECQIMGVPVVGGTLSAP